MRYTNKQILEITYPVLINLFMEHMIGLTDTAYLGCIGEVELGASTLAGVYYLVIYILGFGFSAGVQVLMTRRDGKRECKRVGEVFTQGGLFLSLLVAMLFTASNLLTPYLLHRMIGSEEVYRATMSYLDWWVHGFFFSFMAVMFRVFYVNTTNTKILTASSVVMVLTNVVLNYILTFGKFGFPVLGTADTAIVSSISETVSVTFFVIYTWEKVDYKKYGLFRFTRVDFKMLGQVLSVSIWMMIQHGIAFGGWFIFSVAMGHLDERPLTITSVVRNISSFLFMFVNAFASTNSSLVNSLIGAGESDRVFPLCQGIVGLYYAFVLPIGILIATLPFTALHIYTDNPDLIASSIPSLWVILSPYLFVIPGFIYFFSVSRTGNTRRALEIDIANIFVYILYILYVTVWLRVDVAVCWTAEYVYNIMILPSPFYLQKGNRCNKKI